MENILRQDKVWIGRWLVGVATLHTLVAGLFFGDALLAVLQRGIFDSVGRDPLVATAVWFVLFGAGLAILGLAITALERAQSMASARVLGLAILLLTLLGIVLMPKSGFWLAFPPAIALLLKKPGLLSIDVSERPN
ncbi:MAG: DUF6463 family protein [Pseudomonadota bacterium]